MTMTIEEALNLIGLELNETAHELSDELNRENCDRELIFEIAAAVQKWKARKEAEPEMYLVWLFKDNQWSRASRLMRMEEAYREWYRLTNGATLACKQDTDFYYLIESSTWIPKKEEPEEEDNFSAAYLLNKSFGT